MAYGAAAKACWVALMAINVGAGAAFLYDAQALLEGAHVPLADEARFSPLAREGFLHFSRMFGTACVGLAVFTLLSGPSAKTFLVMAGVSGVWFLEEQKLFATYEHLPACPPAHLAGIGTGVQTQLAMTGVAGVGLLASLLATRFDSKPNHKRE